MSAYKDLKNHIHNTLAITKDELRQMVDKAVYAIVERRVEVLLRDKVNLDRLVDDTIRRKITERNWFWGESEDTLDDYIKKEVVRHLIKGVKLKVEVAKTQKEATHTGDGTVRVRRTRKRS